MYLGGECRDFVENPVLRLSNTVMKSWKMGQVHFAGFGRYLLRRASDFMLAAPLDIWFSYLGYLPRPCCIRCYFLHRAYGIIRFFWEWKALFVSDQKRSATEFRWLYTRSRCAILFYGGFLEILDFPCRPWSLASIMGALDTVASRFRALIILWNNTETH